MSGPGLTEAERFGEALRGITWHGESASGVLARVVADAYAAGLAARGVSSAQADNDLRAAGVDLIAAERRRQVEVEGWTPEHDAEHGSRTLRTAARCYEEHPGDEQFVPTQWPWHESWWKPKDHLSNLIRAGALYQAAADVGDARHLGALHADALARCARKVDAILDRAAALAASPAPTAVRGVGSDVIERVRALADLGVREQWPPDERRAAILRAALASSTPEDQS